MDKLIEKTLKSLKIEFLVVWMLAILLVILNESDILPVGVIADNPRMDFILQTIGILLVFTFIPLSLRLFNQSLIKRIKLLSTEKAIISYRRWSEIRLSLLFVATILNLSFYYLTMNTTGLFCGLMALLATFFCIPTRKRMLKELDIIKNEGE